MRSSEPTGIGKIIALLKKRTKLGKQLKQAQIWEWWPEVVGENLAGHGQPRSIKEKKLVVEVDGATWMHRYAYRKWDIIGEINRRAGVELVSDIFIVLATEEISSPPQDDV